MIVVSKWKWLAVGSMTIGSMLSAFFLWTQIPFAGGLLAVETGNLFTDRHGKTLFLSVDRDGEYHLPKSAFTNLSPYFVAATTTLEDQRFFEHRGIDYRSLGRALWQNARAGEVVSGASTLTWQLAKRKTGTGQRTVWNKTKEALIAKRIEANYDKGEIFAQWADQASFGGNIRGIRAASEFYFRKSPADLSLAEAAYLAGIPQSPERYSPISHPLAAKKRQESALRQMRSAGLITADELESALAQEITALDKPPPIAAPHFVIAVRALAPAATSVMTSLDLGLQQKTEAAIGKHLDLIRGHHADNAAALVIENANGAVRAFVGNADFFNTSTAGQVDMLHSYRQPGSTLKPFIYYLAFRDLGWSADTVVIDEPRTFFTDLGTPFAPKNFDLAYKGEMTVRAALGQSRNVPAVATLHQVGVEKFFQLLKDIGTSPLQTAEQAGLAAALGAAEVLPIELARAYAVLARQGRSIELCFFEPCVGTAGRQVMDKSLTLELTEILSDQIARIDAFGEDSALDLPFAVAVKTGTSRNFRDNYAVGYSNTFTVLVWVGNSDGSPMREIAGVTGAGPIFHDLMVMLNEYRPAQPFATAAPRAAATKTPDVLRILSPQPGTIYALDLQRDRVDQKIKFESNRPVEFVLNGISLGQGKEYFWLPTAGEHRLEARSPGLPPAVTDFVVR